MPSSPSIAQSLFPAAFARLQQRTDHEGRPGDTAAAQLHPAALEAVAMGRGDRIADHVESHLDVLRRVLKEEFTSKDARLELGQQLEDCGEALSRLKTDIDGALRAEAALACDGAHHGDAARRAQERVLARHLALAVRCQEVQNGLQALHTAMGNAVPSRSAARTVALAIGGLLAIAAAATLAALLWPVVTAAAVGGSFLLLGAIGIGGASAAGGIAAVALSVKELVARPLAYRNLPRNQPQLAALIAEIGEGVHAWLRANPDGIARLNDQDLWDIGIAEDDIAGFREAVLSSDLPEEVKSLVSRDDTEQADDQRLSGDLGAPRITVPAEAASEDADVLASPEVLPFPELVRLIAEGLGISEAAPPAGPSHSTSPTHRPDDRSSCSSGSSVATRSVDEEAPDTDLSAFVDIKNELAMGGVKHWETTPAAAGQSRVSQGQISVQSDHEDEDQDEDEDEHQSPLQALAREWKARKDELINLNTGPLDPADHVPAVPARRRHLADPEQVRQLWTNFTRHVTDRLDFANACLQVMQDPNFTTVVADTLTYKVMDHVARLWIFDLLGAELSMIAQLDTLHRDAFLEREALALYSDTIRREQKQWTKAPLRGALRFVVGKESMVVPIDALPEAERSAAREAMQQLVRRASSLSDQLQLGYEQYRFGGEYGAEYKRAAYERGGRHLEDALSKLFNEAQRSMKEREHAEPVGPQALS